MIKTFCEEHHLPDLKLTRLPAEVHCTVYNWSFPLPYPSVSLTLHPSYSPQMYRDWKLHTPDGFHTHRSLERIRYHCNCIV